MTEFQSDFPIEPIPKNALSHAPFRAYVLQRAFSTLGTTIQSVVVGWQVYDITHSTFTLGVVGLMQFLPILVFALLAGNLADRFDRRHILALCIGLQIICAGLLIMLTLMDNRNVHWIYAVLFLFGMARAFMAPATQSVVPRLVPHVALSSAIALGSSVYFVASFIGPALGGFLYIVSPIAAYSGSALFFLASLIATWRIGVKLTPTNRAAISWSSVAAGIHFIRREPRILGSISLDLFAMFLGGATALLPVYARDILMIGPQGLGMLRAAPAIGALLVSLVLSRKSMGGHAGLMMFGCVFIFGIATIVFGLSHNFILSLAALFVLGASDVISVNVRSNLIQRLTPDDMRGRVSAVNWIFIGASNELGEMESGFTAAWFGTVPAVVIGGIGTLIVVGLSATLFPQLRKVRRLEDIEPAK